MKIIMQDLTLKNSTNEENSKSFRALVIAAN